MGIKFGSLLSFGLLLFVTACTSDEPTVYNYYVYDQFGDSSITIHVMDNLRLKVPVDVIAFDSVSVVFPSTGEELKFGASKYEDYMIGSIPVDSLFKQNDSVQLLFRRKNKVIFKPILLKQSDTIRSSGTIKLC